MSAVLDSIGTVVLKLAEDVIATKSPTATAVTIASTAVTWGQVKTVLGMFGQQGGDLDAAIAAEGKNVSDDMIVGADIAQDVGEFLPPAVYAADTLRVLAFLAAHAGPPLEPGAPGATPEGPPASADGSDGFH